MEPGVVGFEVGAQGLEAHGAADLGLFQEALDVPHGEAADGVGQIGAVDGREAVAGLETGHGDPGRLEGGGAGHSRALEEGLALAHQQEGDLAHRREIAARAHRALLAHHRGDARIQHGDQGFGDLRPATRAAVGVDVDPQQHRGADVVLGAGVADPGGVVVDQVTLEIADLVVVENDLRELADPGVDAVHDLARRDPSVEKGPAADDPLAGIGVELDLFAVPRDRDHVLDREVLAGDSDGHERLLVPPGQAERRPGRVMVAPTHPAAT